MRRKILIITVIAAAVMELIDTSIVNVALSYMSGNLGATLEDTSWVITAYAIANVIIIPITSFLAAKLGRRNYYIGSVILFTLFSFLCGQATNIWMLVACRFMQGMGGGALLSVSAAHPTGDGQNRLDGDFTAGDRDRIAADRAGAWSDR